MNHSKWVSPGVIAATIAAMAVLTAAGAASAQHVTPAMAAAMMGTTSPETPGCEDRARQAATALDVLNANLERARRANNDSEMRATADLAQKGFADLTARLGACRGGAPAPAAQRPAAAPAPAAPGAMAGTDHSKMNMGGAKPVAATPAATAMAGMDHSTMNMSPSGAAAAPATIRQISGPAEAALQSFEDALQIGNRDVALQWLAPEATITEAGVTDGSREAYAREHMGVDMGFLKTAKVELLDRQVQPAGDSMHIVSTTRVTGRAGEMPVDVRVTERASLKRTLQGWRIVSLQWTIEPVKADAR